MIGSEYDYDVGIWNPEGRIRQIEFAMEAVKRGSVCVGLRSKDFAVLAALRK